MRVGSLEETITVTAESPIVDVQSVRRQTTVDGDVIAVASDIALVRRALPAHSCGRPADRATCGHAGARRYSAVRADEEPKDVCRWTGSASAHH